MTRIVSDQGGVESTAAVARANGQGLVESATATGTSFQTIAADGAGGVVNAGLAFAQSNRGIIDSAEQTVQLLARASVNNASDTAGLDSSTAAQIA
ncbi:hypothetical protein [Gordonia malaquae]|uniref:hypothetical protein n=1 Tax=Gordonia malaquae TaxID=410332 RepID=UPI003019A5BA